MVKITEIMLLQQPEQYALTIEAQTDMSGIPQTIDSSFMKIGKYIEESGEFPADIPFVEYRAYEEHTENNIRMVVGFYTAKSVNELNMHCHLIVSRKDQSNKKKLSPLTNHKNTKKGAITGGFDRTNLFQQAEQGFDNLFGYDRQLTESFDYYNTMKNGSIADQLKMQEQQISDERKNTDIQKGIYANKQAETTEYKQNIKSSNLELSSVFGVLSPEPSNAPNEQIPVKRKKKKPKRGFKR